jgi:DNA repair exonuclease SbcCD ATPase subunit
LFSFSPGQVATHFNAISKLDSIDVSIKNIKADIRVLEGELKHSNTKEIELKEELKEYENLDKFEAELEVLEDLEKQRNQLIKDYDELSVLSEEITQCQINIDAINETIKIESEVDVLLEKYTKLRKKEKQYEELYDLVYEIKDLDQELFKIEMLIQDEDIVDNMIALIEKRNKLIEEYRELRRFRMELRDSQNALQDIEQKIKELEETFHAEMGDTCPLCGSKIEK